MQETGQRIQMLTFSGSVYINNIQKINNTVNNLPILVRTYRQQLSGSLASDFLPVRDPSPTSNGHFQIIGD